MKPKKQLSVRSPDVDGSWKVNDRRYFENAHVLMEELELVVLEVNHQWPKDLSETVKKGATTKAHWKLVRRRDLLSDSVKIFSAMSVEAFLNFYGVLRLGQVDFDWPLQKLGPVAKLKKLFMLCDNVTLTDNDALVQIVDKIAKRRNGLVHSPTVEVTNAAPAEDRDGDRIPEAARESVADMIAFFQEFVQRKPSVAHHRPPPYAGDA
jgi:hypothetical protein